MIWNLLVNSEWQNYGQNDIMGILRFHGKVWSALGFLNFDHFIIDKDCFTCNEKIHFNGFI